MLKTEDPLGERSLWHSPLWRKKLSQELKDLDDQLINENDEPQLNFSKLPWGRKTPSAYEKRMALSSRATDLKESVKKNDQWTNVKSQEKSIIQDNLKMDLGEQRAESAEQPWNLAAIKL